MTLTQSQKKFIKKNLNSLSLEEIADTLNISRDEILAFLKSHWRKEKFEKFLKRQQTEGNLTSQLEKHYLWQEDTLKMFLKQNWKIFFFLAFLVFVVYFNSLGNDFVSDDVEAIKNNLQISSFAYLIDRRFHLRAIVIFLIHKIFGLNPIFYRLSNILFHLGSVWIIYLLCKLFFKPPIPFFTSSIFAVHPILSESVTWISGGPYSQAGFLILLSFLTYILATGNKRTKLLFLSLISYTLALSSSGKLIIFPLILVFYEFCLSADGLRSLKSNWKKIIPFWELSGFWAFLLLVLLKERVTEFAATHQQEAGFYNPFFQIPIAITSYLWLIFWPKNLTLYHSEMTFTQAEYFLRLGVFILFIIIILYFYKKDRQIFFWLSFFSITLLPSLTPLKIAWIVAERYIYLGSLGIFIIVATAIQKLGTILPKNIAKKKVSYLFLTIILILLSLRTIIRNNDWKNQDALWLATAKTSPSSPQNHNNLGDLYGRHGNPQKAIEEFKMAIKLKPDYADAYHNLANTYSQTGNIEEAIKNYKQAINFNPNLWQSYQNLAGLYFQQGNFNQAKEELEKAVNINPKDSILFYNLGLVYLKLNDKESAKQAFKQSLTLDPENQKVKEILLNEFNL